jgi:hypothetical protein
MNEISLLEHIYEQEIKEMATRIVNANFDIIETSLSNEPEIDPVIRIANEDIRNLPNEDLIKIITVSPLYYKLSENKRGVFVDDNILNTLLSFDNDDVIYAIDAIKESFVEQHENVIAKIIADVQREIPDIAKNAWYEAAPANGF